jgi:hypothetical protein
MNFEQRTKFRLALQRLIDNHQEEFERLFGQSIIQVNNTGANKLQVLVSEQDGIELTMRPVTETEIQVR